MIRELILTISIVIYKSNEELLIETLKTLVLSCEKAKLSSYKIYLINHEKSISENINKFVSENIELIQGHGNIGYGSGHNLVKNRIGNYHLILNPDVKLFEDTIKNSIKRMTEENKVGLITPNATDQNGVRQYLIKSYPSFLIFFLRVTNISLLNLLFKKKLNKYECRELNYNKIINKVIYCSGCYMFFRNIVFKNINGFDENFFLYFEDMDISYRTSKVTNIIYDPNVKIIHYGGNTSRKNLLHWKFFISSMIKFFNKYVWKFF